MLLFPIFTDMTDVVELPVMGHSSTYIFIVIKNTGGLKIMGEYLNCKLFDTFKHEICWMIYIH